MEGEWGRVQKRQKLTPKEFLVPGNLGGHEV